MRISSSLLGVVSISVAVACGSSNHAAPDGGVLDVPVPIDAPVLADAAGSSSSVLLADDGISVISSWTAPVTYAGTSASALLFIYNSGATPTSVLSAALGGGAGASSFAIGSAGTTCGGPLAAGDGCWIDLEFSPAAGTSAAVSASLDIAGAATAFSLPLAGTPTPPPTGGLVANVATLGFGAIGEGSSATGQIILTNASAAPVTLGAMTATAPFAVTTSNCPAMLASSGSCTVGVKYTASLGLSTGTFTATTTGGGTATVALHGIGLRVMSIAMTGFGSGAVTSLPSGIACPSGTCTSMFPGGIPVALIESAASGNFFDQWSGLCSGSGATCVINSPAAGQVGAQFIPSSAEPIAIAMTGPAPGFASVVDASSKIYGQCTASCTVYVPVDSEITLYGFSPSTFGGWSGDCTAATSSCNLGTVTAARAVTLTTSRDAHEVGTIMLPSTISGLAVAPDGDVVVGTGSDVSELTIAGSAVWRTAVTDGVKGLATDTAGDIFAMGSASVYALSPAGAPAWTRAITGAFHGAMNSPIAASPDGTVVAVLTADGVHAVDGSGSDLFTIAGLSPAPLGVAVGSDGTVALTQLVAVDEETVALRCSRTGATLSSIGPIPNDETAQIAFDGTGAVCAESLGESEMTVSRTTSANAQVFAVVESTGFGIITPAGVAVDTSGEVVAARPVQDAPLGGLVLYVYSATGTSVLAQTKAIGASSLGLMWDDYVTPYFLAGGGTTNRVAVAGTYNNNYPWIEIFDVP